MGDIEYYLGDGKFTIVDETVRHKANTLPEKTISEINKYVASIPPEDNEGLKRTRTAAQIIENNFVTGCTDKALVFLALSRALGHPAIYIETVEHDFLKDPEMDPFQGHVFADVFAGGKWAPHNPGYGPTKKEGETYMPYCEEPSKIYYIEIARGRDFSDLHAEGIPEPFELRTTGQIRKTAMRALF